MKKSLVVLILLILIGVLALEAVAFINILKLDQALPSVEEVRLVN